MKINVELQSVLDSIDVFFKEEVDNIKRNFNNYNGTLFDVSCHMVDGNKVQVNNVPGIYVFRVKTKSGIKVGSFNETSYAPKLNQKNHNKLNIKKKSDFLNSQILYLGKSEDNICARLSEHIEGPGKTTYALRLNDQNRSNLIGNLEVLVLELKKQYRPYSKTILSSIESMLHDELYPRVGLKR